MKTTSEKQIAIGGEGGFIKEWMIDAGSGGITKTGGVYPGDVGIVIKEWI